MEKTVRNLSQLITNSLSEGKVNLDFSSDLFGYESDAKACAKTILKHQDSIIHTAIIENFPEYDVNEPGRYSKCVRDSKVFIESIAADTFIGGSFYCKRFLSFFFTYSGENFFNSELEADRDSICKVFNTIERIISELLVSPDTEGYSDEDLDRVISTLNVRYFSRRRSQAHRFRQDVIPSEQMIHEILEMAYNTCPSKQSLYPWQLNVYGPDCLAERKFIFNHSNYRSEDAVISHCTNHQLEDAPYVVMITSRISRPDDQNEENRARLADFVHPALVKRSDDNRNWYMEIGNLQQLIVLNALSRGVDISFCGNIEGRTIAATLFPDNPEIEIAFTLSLGYRVPIDEVKEPWVQYRNNDYKKDHYPKRAFRRPDSSRVIKFHESTYDYSHVLNT